MANLQVNIEIPEEEFKQVCIDNINDLPKEQMQELLLKAVEIALIEEKKNPNPLYGRNILVEGNSSGYTTDIKPTKLMKEIMQGINAGQYIEPLAKEVAEYIKENYARMVREYMVEAFTNMLFSEAREWNMRSYVNQKIHDAFEMRR